MPSIINASSSGSGGLISTADASGVLQLQTNGTTALTVATGAGIGIGTALPSAQLEVSRSATDAYSTFRLSNSGASGRTYEIGVGGNTTASGFANNLYFYDSTASAIRMAITSAGNITAPSQTGFKAAKLSNTQSITGSTWTRVSFNSTASTGCFNTGNAYSTSTNRFTAPVAGKYLFTASVNINAGAAGQMYIDFGLNGSNNVGMEATVAYPAGDTSLTISTVISMAANDTMEVDLFTTNATTAGNRICGFSGQLLS